MGEDGLIEIGRTIVVANHVVHIFGTVLSEKRLVRCPTGKQQEQLRIVLVYDVNLFHSSLVLSFFGYKRVFQW